MYDLVYKRGIAVGHSNIRDDSLTFRWRDEVYEVPILQAIPPATHNGYYYEMKIKTLRQLAQKHGIRRSR